ncbi:MAG: type II secretion system F family protein [Candidatus Brocadiia bacterium]
MSAYGHSGESGDGMRSYPPTARAVPPGKRGYARRARAALRALLGRDRSGQLALPLRELATLLAAGIPLVESLEAIADETESRRVASVLTGLRDRILGGYSLSGAAAEYPAYFGPAARSMLEAGEISGELDAAVRRLSSDLMRGREIRARVTGALVYPAILAVVSAAVVAFLLAYVVPRVSAIYTATGVALPLPTRVLLAVSGFVSSHWFALVLGAVLAAVGLRLALLHEGVALRWDGLKLRLPFVGKVFRKRCVAEFCGTLCGLLEAGVPLVDALRVTSGTLPNRLAAREVRRVAAEVERGFDGSQAVRAGRTFPKTVAEMMAAGEASGEVEELLRLLADDYARQVEVTAERACRALEPLVVVLMGGVVLFIVLAVLLPIVQVSQVVQI